MTEDEPLCRPDDRTHDEASDERRSHGIDSVHDDVRDVAADGEADEDRHWPEPDPTRDNLPVIRPIR